MSLRQPKLSATAPQLPSPRPPRLASNQGVTQPVGGSSGQPKAARTNETFFLQRRCSAETFHLEFRPCWVVPGRQGAACFQTLTSQSPGVGAGPPLAPPAPFPFSEYRPPTAGIRLPRCPGRPPRLREARKPRRGWPEMSPASPECPPFRLGGPTVIASRGLGLSWVVGAQYQKVGSDTAAPSISLPLPSTQT